MRGRSRSHAQPSSSSVGRDFERVVSRRNGGAVVDDRRRDHAAGGSSGGRLIALTAGQQRSIFSVEPHGRSGLWAYRPASYKRMYGRFGALAATRHGVSLTERVLMEGRQSAMDRTLQVSLQVCCNPTAREPPLTQWPMYPRCSSPSICRVIGCLPRSQNVPSSFAGIRGVRRTSAGCGVAGRTCGGAQR